VSRVSDDGSDATMSRRPGIDLERATPLVHASIEISVCICTYRRASLQAAVESVAKQILPEGFRSRIFVIDNDAQPTANVIVNDLRNKIGPPITYLHCPGQNISIARNVALSTVSTRWMAFIDDDEFASPQWLGELLLSRHGAQAVFGPCEAIYGKEIPSWMRRADFHSTRVPTGQFPIITGYAGNSLIDMCFVRQYGLNFDIRLGRSGGEDTVFFHEMYQLGGTLRYAPKAIAYEEVAPFRSTVKWVARRRYRTGQSYALMLRRSSKLRFVVAALTSPLKILLCTVISACCAPHRSVASAWLMRGVFHTGVLCYALGFSVHQEYGGAAAAQREADGFSSYQGEPLAPVPGPGQFEPEA
jgi:succinoglycan biosynthesis protein ExoM